MINGKRHDKNHQYNEQKPVKPIPYSKPDHQVVKLKDYATIPSPIIMLICRSKYKVNKGVIAHKPTIFGPRLMRLSCYTALKIKVVFIS